MLHVFFMSLNRDLFLLGQIGARDSILGQKGVPRVSSVHLGSLVVSQNPILTQNYNYIM